MWPFKHLKKKEVITKKEPYNFFNPLFFPMFTPKTVEDRVAELEEQVDLLEQYLKVHIVTPAKGYKRCKNK